MSAGSIVPLWLLLWTAQDAPRPAGLGPVLVQPASTPHRRLLVLERIRPKEADDLDETVGRGQAGPVALAAENFDLWVFEVDEDDRARRAHLTALLAERIESVGRPRQLDAGQVGKLRLAGSGDIQRLFDRTARARADFEVVRRDPAAGRRLLVRLEGLAREHRTGPFEGNSLFAKTLRKIDDDARRARRRPA